jgi:hypothetical protein
MIEAGAIELFSWEASGDAECMRAVFIAISKRSKSSGVGLLGKTDNAALAWLIDLALPILPASAIQSGEYMVRMQRLFWADEGN